MGNPSREVGEKGPVLGNGAVLQTTITKDQCPEPRHEAERCANPSLPSPAGNSLWHELCPPRTSMELQEQGREQGRG